MPRESRTPQELNWRRSRNGRTHGFTLIELLVVIAIVSILAAILFPVFAQAREKARAIACLSNMKQFGSAIQMYTQDNDERIFYRAGWANSRSGNIPTTNATRWYNQVMPYIKSSGVFTCPDDANPTPSVDVNGKKTILRSYIANSPAESLTLAQVNDPVETMVITEKWSTDASCAANAPGCVTDSWLEPFNGDMQTDPTNPTKMYKVANRHTGLANCVFYDGHAKALHMADIQNSVDVSGCALVKAYPLPGITYNGPVTNPPNAPYSGLGNLCANANLMSQYQ